MSTDKTATTRIRAAFQSVPDEIVVINHGRIEWKGSPACSNRWARASVSSGPRSRSSGSGGIPACPWVRGRPSASRGRALRGRPVALPVCVRVLGQAAHCEAATVARDLKAAHLVVQIIMQRSALLRLDHRLDAGKDPVHTIVIGGTSEEYIAGLEAIIGGDR